MVAELITEVTVIPDGMPWNDYEMMTFAIKVTYRGTYVRRSAEELGEVAWYSVEHGGSSLSRAGTWYFVVQRFQRWQYRFEYEEALDWARGEVNTVRVNGRTWSEWQQERTRLKVE